jgi:hypothetical protein
MIAFLRLLGPQGLAGIAASLCLGMLLVMQKADTRHWQRQSGRFEQLYRESEAARADLVAGYRAAAERAAADDAANAERVRREQIHISQRIEEEYDARIADARARALRLRRDPQAASHPGGATVASLPGLSTAPGEPVAAARQDRLPDSLIATEQAIQLDALIKWVHAQGTVDSEARAQK